MYRPRVKTIYEYYVYRFSVPGILLYFIDVAMTRAEKDVDKKYCAAKAIGITKKKKYSNTIIIIKKNSEIRSLRVRAGTANVSIASDSIPPID